MKQFLIILILLLFTFINATIINIPADQPTIQAGINASVHGDTVLVQPGRYYENINYNGKNITIASLYLTTQDSLYIEQTKIDGNNSGSVVLFQNNENNDAKLIGFSIINGNSLSGGGIRCDSSNPTLLYLKIFNNSANTGQGGGIYCHTSSPIIKYSKIFNKTSGQGGGIF